MSQYALPLTLPAVFAEENFIVSACNREAHRLVTGWPDAWQSLLLSGPAGAGKTHLGHIWAARAGGAISAAKDCVPGQIATHCLLEDIEEAEGKALLHAINYAKERGFSLLLTARAPARQLDFTLPDLTSRLLAMPAASIALPDDEALAAALRKQFADRQVSAPEEVINYLLARMERSFQAARHYVAILDNHAWEKKKSLTVPLAREALSGELTLRQ